MPQGSGKVVIVSDLDYLGRSAPVGGSKTDTALLPNQIGALDAGALRLLHAAVVGFPAALPPVLIRRLAGDAAAEEVVDALQRALAVTPTPGGWQVHAVVRDTSESTARPRTGRPWQPRSLRRCSAFPIRNR